MVRVGSRVGAYEIIEPIGSGGMGLVYRARDARLERDAALKCLPIGFSNDSERLARFKREARILASLNHPNIAQVYGLEEFEGTNVIAMELIRGETLADRLRHRPLGPSEALRIAHGIANGLEAAHDRGIVHRDLKPANVMLQGDGEVKILDFGLSKTLPSSPEGADPSNSSTRAELTHAGLILGTAAYMSPEQATGTPTDQRTDIFSFGCVLYEMLTGIRAFPRTTSQDVLVSVLTRDPDLDALPPTIHPGVRALVQHCLEKSLRNRWHAIGDVRIEIERILSDLSGGLRKPDADRQRLWYLTAAAAIIGAAVALAGLRAWNIPPRPDADSSTPVRRFSMQLDYVRPVISPDGRHIAYRSQDRLWVRDLSTDTSREITGGEAKGGYYSDVGYYLAWSPDSQSLAFVAEDEIRRVSISEGHSPTTICKVPPTLRGTNQKIGSLAWSNDGSVLVFSRYGNGVFEVPARGGSPTRLMDEDHADDIVLIDTPRGRALVFAILKAGIHHLVVRTPEGERREIAPLETGWPELVYLSTGHILFRKNPVDSPSLWALPFSPTTLTATGGAFMVERSGQGMSIARDGTLVYLDVGRSEGQVLAWRDRAGKVLAKATEGHEVIQVPRLSPDGTHAIVVAGDTERPTLWLYDVRRFVKTRFVKGRGLESKTAVAAFWSRRGDQILYALADPSVGEPRADSFSASADGTGQPTKLPFPEGFTVAQDVSPDGRYLLAAHATRGQTNRVWYLRTDRTENTGPVDFSQNAETEQVMNLAPNGRYVAYTSTIGGRLEVYVRPFPEGPGRWQISSNGGAGPRWGRDGTELFFVQANNLMRVAVSTSGQFAADAAPTPLFEHPALTVGPGGPRYDISPDGRQILTVESLREFSQPVVRIIENWLSNFRSRLSTSDQPR
jgi:eukaryotic-like serine/threonine-protein kinase